MSDLKRFADSDVALVSKETLWKGRFQMDRYRLKHRKHDGGWTEEFAREIFERGHAAAVLPYDAARDRVVLIEQFRPGAYAAGLYPWLVEIVAGIIDPGETAEQVVRREAIEEAGVTLGKVEAIAHTLMTPGGCSEHVSIFCGEIADWGGAGLHGLAHEHEDIRVFSRTTDEAAAMLDAGQIHNAITVIALHWLLRQRERLRRDWAPAGEAESPSKRRKLAGRSHEVSKDEAKR